MGFPEVAIPVVILGIRKWLQGFAYKTSVQWWIYLSVGIVFLLAALVVTSFHTIKSATENPVDSFRYG